MVYQHLAEERNAVLASAMDALSGAACTHSSRARGWHAEAWLL